jgi:hypothetical protein
MTKLTVCVVVAALSSAATVAIAQTAPTTNDQEMAAPAAADPAVRAKVMDSVKAAPAASQRSGQGEMPGTPPLTPEAPTK